MARQRRAPGQGGLPGPPSGQAAPAALSPALMQQLAGWQQGFQKVNLAINTTAQTSIQASAQMVAAQGKVGAAILDTAKAGLLAGRLIANSYSSATSAMTGWVRAGLAGTTIGERLAFTQRMLNQQIASLFVPYIEKAIALLQRLTNWFRQLTGAQQDAIARWIGLAVAMRLVGMSVSPLLTIVLGLFNATDEGRTALSEMGTTLLETFKQVAQVLGQLLLPVLQALAEFAATATGRWVLFGLVFVSMAIKVVTAVRTMIVAFGLLKLSIGGAIAAAAILASVLIQGAHASEKEAAQAIIAQVKSGRITREQAEEQLEALAKEAGDKERMRLAEAAYIRLPGGKTREEIIEAGGKEAEEAVREQRRKYLPGADKGRSDVVPSRSGTEDARATIRRLEESFLKADAGRDTANNTKETAETLKQIWNFARFWGDFMKPPTDRPPAQFND